MPSPRFATTHWSVVLAAGGEGGDGRRALESLCQTYWYPLYAYARRSGRGATEAEDSVQGFFAALLARGGVAAADPERGRFRSYLLTAFRNHMRDEAAAARAKKRGGGVRPISLDVEPEVRFALEPAHEETPERVFLRAWAHTVLGAVLERLRVSYAKRGQEELFVALQGALTGQGDHADRAEELGMTSGAVRVAVHRMRSRYRAALIDEVAQTLAPGEAPEDEVQALIAALAGA